MHVIPQHFLSSSLFPFSLLLSSHSLPQSSSSSSSPPPLSLSHDLSSRLLHNKLRPSHKPVWTRDHHNSFFYMAFYTTKWYYGVGIQLWQPTLVLFVYVTYVCFFIHLLAVQPGVARAFALRSTLSLRSCGSVQLPHFLVGRLSDITLWRNFVLLWASVGWKKKKPFSNGKRHMLQVTSSPAGSLPFCFSRSSSKVIALRDVLLRVSV